VGNRDLSILRQRKGSHSSGVIASYEVPQLPVAAKVTTSMLLFCGC
jgi:hypothetical protein